MVHNFVHMGDDSLCKALDAGSYAWADITPTDVRLNRKLRGPCIQCIEAKLDQRSMPASTTPPATRVGDMLSIDTNTLTVKSYGGNLNFIDSLDEFSGDRRVMSFFESEGHF